MLEVDDCGWTLQKKPDDSREWKGTNLNPFFRQVQQELEEKDCLCLSACELFYVCSVLFFGNATLKLRLTIGRFNRVHHVINHPTCDFSKAFEVVKLEIIVQLGEFL